MSQLNWTEAQWNRVNSAITEEFTKASVAGACLPCYGPMGASMEAVSRQVFTHDTNNNSSIIKISDNDTTPFWTLRTFVHLNSQQVADESLSSALFAFKRAANLLAQTEDYVVFQGHDGNTPPPRHPLASAKRPGVFRVPSVRNLDNLIGDTTFSAPGLLSKSVSQPNLVSVPVKVMTSIIGGTSVTTNSYGENLVSKIAEAISKLESNGYPGPFACALGHKAFIEAQTPGSGSLVLPADRITPMLGGPLIRSGNIPLSHGLVASSCGESLDIVVATPPKAQFLHVNDDAKYVFRVYERFVLRIKDPNAVVPIELED